jgi:uncharacterized protein (TIGR02646 family)
MIPCTRGPEPEALARDAVQIGRDYAARRREDPSHSFRWPRRGGRSLLEVAREALSAMTAGHCSYCDGHPLGATSVETVDHFQPKSLPEFYELVCTWTNLFLTCSSCNHAKREQWDEALLRPDDPAFRFERYFEVRFDSGKLEPAAAASPQEQERARRTIEILGLNRADARSSRLRVVRWMRRSNAEDEPADSWPYRYLLPLSRG